MGLLLSLRALEAGHRVIATVRNPKRLIMAVNRISIAGGKVITLDLKK